MRLVALSDTHGLHNRVTVPDGDVLIHAGDFMNSGRYMYELNEFATWFCALPHKRKILVAGNHDRRIETMQRNGEGFPQEYFPGVDYLCQSGIMIDGLVFWGSPFTPEFMNWAFNVPRSELHKYWAEIPDDTDVLITHGPPWGKLDGPYPIVPGQEILDGYLGCVGLKYRVEEVGPRVHIFGHLHRGYGHAKDISTRYYNVAILDEKYQVVNPCTIIDL